MTPSSVNIRGNVYEFSSFNFNFFMVFHLFFHDIVEYFYLDNSSFFFAQNNMINILGIVSGYSFVSKCFWVDIEDVFVMLDKEKQRTWSMVAGSLSSTRLYGFTLRR